jgi:hypothetical protein
MVKMAGESVRDAEIRESGVGRGATATPVRLRYWKRGPEQPGDKLPPFDREGAQIGRVTIDPRASG